MHPLQHEMFLCHRASTHISRISSVQTDTFTGLPIRATNKKSHDTVNAPNLFFLNNSKRNEESVKDGSALYRRRYKSYLSRQEHGLPGHAF